MYGKRTNHKNTKKTPSPIKIPIIFIIFDPNKWHSIHTNKESDKTSPYI